MRIWVKEIQAGKPVKDIVIENNENDTRTHKVFDALDKACVEFDLPVPIWLDKNVREFQRSSRTKFYSDSFIEPIDFEHLDFHVLEEDCFY